MPLPFALLVCTADFLNTAFLKKNLSMAVLSNQFLCNLVLQEKPACCCYWLIYSSVVWQNSQNCVNQVKHDKYAFAKTFTIQKRLYPNINSMLFYHQCLPFVPEPYPLLYSESRIKGGRGCGFSFLGTCGGSLLPCHHSPTAAILSVRMKIPSLAGG